MPSTREQQRNELHKTIWSIADNLRGSVDGWNFKQYIPDTLFYRLISKNPCSYLAEQGGDPGFSTQGSRTTEPSTASRTRSSTPRTGTTRPSTPSSPT